MRHEEAKYNRAILPEHCGNPLIEALPVKLCDDDLVDVLSYYPPYSSDEMKLEPSHRVEYLTRLKALRQPLPIYFDCFRAIEIAIKEGYSAKNPLSPTTMNYLHYPVGERTKVEPGTGYFQAKGCGITIIGESGVGKTCMLEQILCHFPDTITHTRYNGMSIPLRQVVWIKVDCPEDSSIRALCHKILTELDIKMGLEPTAKERTIPSLIEQIEARIKSSFLGILVIDEMQNLNLAKTGGADRLLGFIHNLVNNLGIPIIFCANPPFNKLLSKTLKTARRAESNGYFDFELMENDEVWGVFVEELWDLQWTNVKTPLSQELNDTLYDLSVGNIDLAVRIFREAQRYIIGAEDERNTPEVLRHASSIAIRASKDITDEMKRERSISLLKRKKKESSPVLEKSPSDERMSLVHSGNLQTIPGDLTRPHHPEFSSKINQLQNTEDLYPLIGDMDLIQRAATQDDPLELLRAKNILCEDPLEKFA
ncbi:ATP-binding protein [Zobellella endophytica]|uniref:ATP-binding protein n=1 Tax=Zobellella endophytica TaxID=2116700 RepID=A0A2P7R4W2_9GAMM|nr:ATP-binding protein [Zobellella endophytica]PSJ45245.1 ATP-binding protein [Zobellella endophytica]